MNVKSLLTVLTTALLTYGGLATIKPLDFNTCTEAEVRAKVEECLAPSNKIEKLNNLILAKIAHYMITRKDFDELRAELDARFASEKIVMSETFFAGWPKCAAASMERIERVFPIRAGLLKKYADQRIIDSCPSRLWTAEELVTALNEALTKSACTINFATRTLELINKKSIKIVRKHLYEQGQSFITKNGVNPCEQYVSELTVAINAPRLAGLNEWLAKMGVSYRINLDFLPSEEEVAKLELDILTGEKDITEKDKVILYFGLGSEKYNAFVKRYNGDK